MIKQHLRFQIPDNFDVKLWRYVPIRTLELLFKKSSLYCRRSDLFDDKHEGSYTITAAKHRKKFYEGAYNNFLENTIPKLNLNWKKCAFISCWHVNDKEDTNMWKAYSKENQSLAITTSISRIKNHILDTDMPFALGFVNYIDYDIDTIPEHNAFNSFYFKRKEFEGEREFRVIAYKDVDKIMNGQIEPPDGMEIPIDVENFIEDIYVSPFASERFFNRATSVIKKYQMENKLKKSKLISAPRY
jgi:hypothetical protein